ncbi:DUF2231 domain-containing protein [Aureimonas fodinaquatilis]|uniref:DUF2231 domain-containing protein n=1 Tax=Aureimonas fodinaquatilis TaxID=2565783 RepID=A0A5B0DXJ0_9HYPH|nr:DUF2231 domain-containing protein [Aureimonas fodinaquatilis]KAA0970270.1 DUF2231 domain-containing protein [Aureimonas fodinaquatilis]
MSSYPYVKYAPPTFAGSAYRIISAFPIAAFSLTIVTDVAYWQTANLLWLHFSEWLLFAGIIFGVLAALVRVLEAFTGGTRHKAAYYIAGAAVLLLALVNNFVHTADGITAVIPYGLALSILTAVAMCAAGLFGRIGGHYA